MFHVNEPHTEPCLQEVSKYPGQPSDWQPPSDLISQTARAGATDGSLGATSYGFDLQLVANDLARALSL